MTGNNVPWSNPYDGFFLEYLVMALSIPSFLSQSCTYVFCPVMYCAVPLHKCKCSCSMTVTVLHSRLYTSSAGGRVADPEGENSQGPLEGRPGSLPH